MILKQAGKKYLVRFAGLTRYFETKMDARKYMETVERQFLQLN